MKILFCLVKQEFISHGQVPCFRILEAKEIDEEETSIYQDEVFKRYQKFVLENPGHLTMYFHLPSIDPRNFIGDRAEGSEEPKRELPEGDYEDIGTSAW